MFIWNQKTDAILFEKSFYIKKYSSLKKNDLFNLQSNLYKYYIIIGIILFLSSFFVFDSIFAQSSLNSPPSMINSTEVETLYNTANNFYNNQKYDEALQYFDKALTIDPSSVNALNNKGTALDHLKRYNEALQFYDKALSIDPSSVNALNNKATTLDHLQRYDEALQFYDKALSIDPSSMKALNGKASILAELKKK